MDDLRNQPRLNDFNKSETTVKLSSSDDLTENHRTSRSPIFKILGNKTNKTTPSKSVYNESPGYDFPSYQINQSVNKNTSSKSENEINCIDLPSSPIFSPVIISSHRFRAPSIHSLNTIAKRCNSNFLCKDQNNENHDTLKKKEPFQKGIYDNLKITDLDISWVSSMASPPAQPPNSEFNTIERATFLPEEKFQKIQPRALFSPASDDNFGCSPLPLTSASEDEEEVEAYKSKTRLSDVCTTLTELKFKSQELVFLETNESGQLQNKQMISCNENYNPKSPVFIVKPKQLGFCKKKIISVKSPDSSLDFRSHPELKNEKISNDGLNSMGAQNNYSDQNLHSKEDESFLDISFSQLDKMCNSLHNQKHKFNEMKESVPFLIDIFLNEKPKDFDLSPLQSASKKKKHYYLSESSAELDYTGKYFSSFDEIFNTCPDDINIKVPKNFFNNNRKQLSIEMPQNELGLVKNDKNQTETSTVEKLKQHSKEINEFKINEANGKKKEKKNDSLDAVDEEEKMLKAVEEAEKTLAEETQMSKVIDEMEGTIIKNNLPNMSTSMESYDCIPAAEVVSLLKPISKDTFKNLVNSIESKPVHNQFLAAFSAASGSRINISVKALNKAKKFLEMQEEEEALRKPSNSPSSHSTGDIESKLFLSSKELPKEIESNKNENRVTCYSKQDSEQVLFVQNAIHVPNIMLSSKSHRADIYIKTPESCTNILECDTNIRKSSNDHSGNFDFSNDSEIKIFESKSTLEQAKKLKLVCDGNESLIKENEYSFTSEPVRTSTPLPFQDDEKVIKKKKLNHLKSPKFKVDRDINSRILENKKKELNDRSSIKEVDFTTNSKISQKTLNSMTDCGFSTASGLKVSVSSKALTKAREILAQCDIVNDECGLNEKISTSLPVPFNSDVPVSCLRNENLIEKNYESQKGMESIFEINKGANERGIFTLNSQKTPKNSKNPVQLRHTVANELQHYSGIKGKNAVKKSAVSEKALPIISAPCEYSNISLEQNIDVGFSTASGLKVTISKRALMRAKDSMAKIDSETANAQDIFYSSNFSKPSTPKLFSEISRNTKSHGTLERDAEDEFGFGRNDTSELSVLKFESTSKIMREKEFNFEISESNFLNDALPKTKVINELEKPQMGFTTCLGKKIEVSADALLKARQLMSSLSEKTLINDSMLENDSESELINNGTSNLEVNAPDDKNNKGKQCNQASFTSEEYTLCNNSKKNLEKCLISETTDCNCPIIGFGSPMKLANSENLDIGSSSAEEWSKFATPEILEDSINKELITKNGLIEEDKIKTGQYGSKFMDEIFEKTNLYLPQKMGVKRYSEEVLKSCKRIKYIEENASILSEKRLEARQQQETVIRKKEKVKPLLGSHLKKKYTVKQFTLMQTFKNLALPNLVEKFSFSLGEAFDFKFRDMTEFEGAITIQLDDGFILIPNDKNEVGVEEFKKGFLAGPGVQPNLIPQNWVENHFKLIIWKLANYEKIFPQFFSGKALTPNNVLLQLKYRYDREIDRSHRSALKKILEKDDSSLRRLILRVCGIEKVSNDETVSYKLLLTDGWYICPTIIDSAMTKLIEKGKIFLGMKLITQGAILINCDQGLSPLEITENVYLKIFTNSTRKANWDAKLGFQKNPCCITVGLDSISPEGGLISRIDIIVVRVYPLLYTEKTPEGRRIVRNRRGEEQAESEYRRLLEQKIEIIYSSVRSEIKYKGINKKEEYFSQDIEAVKNYSDSSTEFNIQDQLSKEISKRVEEKLKKENIGKRDVCELFKVKILDLRKPIYSNPTILSIWNPGEDVIRMFTEGKSISLTNLTVNSFTRGGMAKQINTTRQTRFRELNHKCEYPARCLTPIKNLSNIEAPAPVFGEIDLVGVVLSVEDMSHFKSVSEIVYLADSEFKFVGLFFNKSVKVYGWENILLRTRVVACSNLCWTLESNVGEIPVLHVKETSTFTENPKADYLKEGLENLKENLSQDISQFCSESEEIIRTKLKNFKDRVENFKKEKSEAETSTSYIALDDIQTKEETSFDFHKKDKNAKETESTSASKEIEKFPRYGGRSYFRWLPYKNI